MKILFVTYDFPYPTNSGGKTRAYNLIKYRNRDVEMFLFSFIREGFDKKYIQHMKDMGIMDVMTVKRKEKMSIRSLASVIHPKHSVFYGLYFDTEIASKIYEYVKKCNIDLVHFESYYTAFYLSDTLRAMGVKQLFGTENIEANVYADHIAHASQWYLKPFLSFQNKKIRREEEAMLGSADVVLSVTPSEKEYSKQYTDKRIDIIPNGVDLRIFTFSPDRTITPPVLLFVGNFTYHPNVDAALYLYHSVIPYLPSEYKIRIVGKDAGRLPFAPDNRLQIDDYVSDIRDAYNDASIFVSPVRIGGGTNFKILESMAVGLPIVASPSRMADIGAKDHEHMLFADTGEEYAAAISTLLTDVSLRKSIVKNARKLVEDKFSWEVIGKAMNASWKSV